MGHTQVEFEPEAEDAIIGANYMQSKSELVFLRWVQSRLETIKKLKKKYCLPCKDCYGIGQREMFFPYKDEKGLMECPRCCGNGWVCISCTGHEQSCGCGEES